MVEQLESRVLYSAVHGAAAHLVPAVPTGWHASPVVPIDSIAPTPVAPAAGYTGSSTAFGLTPAQMRGAYGLNGITADGAGQTIAIIDAYNDPTITTDLQSFDTYFGLSAPPSFQVLNQTGGTSLPGTDPEGPYSSTGGGDWEEEESLDVEWAHVMAPDANIILFEASNAGSGLYTAISTARSTAGVTVVSMSWGGSEFSGETTYDSAYFTTPSGHIGAGGVTGGITFLASSGDDGAGTQYPAASPNVVGVGGTTLTLSGTSYVSESGWSGSGGGISADESQPVYQNGTVTQSTTKRTIPDVSIDADPNSGVPIYDSYDFGASTPWVPGYEGGTSLACPMWAGLIALADQDRAQAGLGSLNGATQTLPQLYKLPSSDFHDVTTGNNGYAAGPGYDLVTGLGSPVANHLVPDLANVPTPTPTPTATLTISGPASVSEGSAYTLDLSASDPGQTINSWSINWGDGTTQSITGNPASVTHTYATGPNSYTISATATDGVGTYTSNTQAVSVTHVPPVLTISGVSSVAEGATYTLNLSASDPGHPLSGWSINWGDGTAQTVSGTPSSVTHTYATGPNSYTISATATDNVGTYAVGNSVTVSVTHVPPVLTISGASSVAEQSAYTLSLSASDPGHPISGWSINWGDGTTQTVTGTPSSVTHAYATGPNSYTISATATDNVGTYAAGNSVAVSVTHVPPVLSISGASSVAEQSAYTLSLSASDPGHPISGWSIYWGDGTTQSVTGTPSSVTHTYAIGPNSYTISAAATDNVGTYAADNSVAVSVTHVPPSLTISGASSVAEQSAYTLSLSASDPGHPISGWSINWGDGTTQTVTGTPSSVTHTYAIGPNSYTITATATDNVGTYAADNSVAVSVTHVPPSLTISGASSEAEQSAYTLSLSTSDPGHLISGWSINWGDGTTQTVSGTPSSVTHAYATGPNSYTISATATDNVGTYPAGNSVAVSVTHVPPTLAISGASSVAEQSAYTLSLSASDPGHAISGWSINWGDGTIQAITGDPAAAPHTYAAGPSSYTITAAATDDAGTYPAGNSQAVSVTHVPPVLAISGASSVAERSPYTLDLSATDPGHTISSWSIDWGDGTTQEVTGNPESVTHTYATGPNSYTITATATDDVGTYPAGNTHAVSVTHVPPALAISGAGNAVARSTYTLSLFASDPGHTISSWSINWGDGTTQEVTGNPESVTHTYATGPNNYTISAAATDDAGTYAAGNTSPVLVALAIGPVGKTTLGQTGSLTASDDQALYQVTVAQLANLSVALTGKKQKLNLVLLDAQMNPVQTLAGKKSLSLSRRIGPGTYFLQVELPGTQPTAFALKLSAKPIAPPRTSKRASAALARR